MVYYNNNDYINSHGPFLGFTAAAFVGAADFLVSRAELLAVGIGFFLSLGYCFFSGETAS